MIQTETDSQLSAIKESDLLYPAFQAIENNFQHQLKLPQERPQTEQESELISEVLRYLPRIVDAYGGSHLPLRPDHFHFFDPKTPLELQGPPPQATFIYDLQMVAIFEASPSLLRKAHLVGHEGLHFYSPTFLSMVKGKPMVSQYGLTQFSYPGRELLPNFPLEQIVDQEAEIIPNFLETDEAVTAELTKELDHKYFRLINPLQRDINQRERYKTFHHLSGDDLAYVKPPFESEQAVPIPKNFSYQREREALRQLTFRVASNSSYFNQPKDIFALFAEAYMTGDSQMLEDVVEKALGKGSFRQIGLESSGVYSGPRQFWTA